MHYVYKCEVTRVVDGDTVDVDIDLGFGVWLRKQRIRMLGIDTPESRTRDLEEKKYGKAAAAFLKEQIEKGKVSLRTSKDGKGKFGRILGELFVDGTNINQLMIEKHHAVAYFGQSKKEIEEEHLENRKKVIL